MTRPPAPLSSRGRPRYLQQCQQPLGPPRGPYREGRAAAPLRTLPRTVRPGLKCRLVHAPHSKFGTPVRDRKKDLKYRSGACMFWADRKLLLRAGAGSPIAPGRGSMSRLRDDCQAESCPSGGRRGRTLGWTGRWRGKGANVLGGLGGAVTQSSGASPRQESEGNGGPGRIRPASVQRSNQRASGSSISSLTRPRNRDASRPSTMR